MKNILYAGLLLSFIGTASAETPYCIQTDNMGNSVKVFQEYDKEVKLLKGSEYNALTPYCVDFNDDGSEVKTFIVGDKGVDNSEIKLKDYVDVGNGGFIARSSIMPPLPEYDLQKNGIVKHIDSDGSVVYTSTRRSK